MSEASPTLYESLSPPRDRTEARLQIVDEWIEQASDRFNPILVKETRQALKGRGFAMTFMVVLLLAWAWSIFGVAIQSPGIYYVASGPYMLAGFLVVAALPLLIVIPFTAFRSMASEREEGTFELLSITNLKPWQLVTGKLCSAGLQILIYLSALAPCIAFTYFLRGIDIFMILLILAGAVLLSLLLSAFGLLMAANSPLRWHTVSSVVLLLLLVGVTFWSCGGLVAMLASGMSVPIRNSNTWIAVSGVFTTWICLMALFVLAAAAAVTFASDNRSTPLRVATLLTHAVWFGWATWIWQTTDRAPEAMYGYVLPAAVFWWVVGSCISGERTQLTPRVRRRLPRSAAGRMFGMPLFPGRGLGYLFVVANVVAMVVLCLIFVYWSERGGREEVAITTLLVAAYLIGYVGLANLMMRWSGTYNLEGPARGVLANFLLVLCGGLVPWSIHLSNARRFGDAYSLIEVSNPIWTLIESMGGGIPLLPLPGSHIYLVPWLVMAFAGFMLFLNLWFASRELTVERTAVPQRVADETAASDAGPDSPPVPSSPWDDMEPSNA